jgi:hypothetical protein
MEIYKPPKSDINILKKNGGKLNFFVKTLLAFFLLWVFYQTTLTFQASKIYYTEWSKAYVYGHAHMVTRCAYILFMFLSFKYLRIGCFLSIISCIFIATIEIWFAMPYSSIITSWWYFPVVSVVFLLFSLWSKKA